MDKQHIQKHSSKYEIRRKLEDRVATMAASDVKEDADRYGDLPYLYGDEYVSSRPFRSAIRVDQSK